MICKGGGARGNLSFKRGAGTLPPHMLGMLSGSVAELWKIHDFKSKSNEYLDKKEHAFSSKINFPAVI